MKTYLEDAEALDGLEFLSMAEASELAPWEILAKFNETANDTEIDKHASHGTAYLSSMRSRYAGTPCCGLSPGAGRCRGVEL
jgi:hypothetical protein